MYNKRTVPVSHSSLFSALVLGDLLFACEAKRQSGRHSGLGSDGRKDKLDSKFKEQVHSLCGFSLGLPASLRFLPSPEGVERRGAGV